MNRQTEARAQGAGVARPGAGRAWERAGLAALFLALLALCGLFPLTGDDWFREELGRRLTGPMDLLGTVFHGWRTYNGRILGNLLAYAAGSRRLLRELLRAAFLFGTVRLAAGHGGFRIVWGTLLTAAALLALPRDMFAQIYPWAAGFFNYVPPVTLALAALRLLGDLFAERPVPGGGPRAAAVFLLGLCGALFVEHVALYGVWAGVRGVGRVRPAGVVMAEGDCLGLCSRLLRRDPAGGAGAVSVPLLRADLGRGSLFRRTVGERGGESPGGRLRPDLQVPGAVPRSDRPGAGVVCRRPAGGGWFILCGLSGGWTIGEALAAALWGTALWTGCWRWMPRGERKNRALFFLASAGVGALPLLAVSPIGPRCLYWSYVCLTIAAGNLLSALPLGLLPRRLVRGTALGLAAGALAFYLALFFPIRVLEVERLAALEEVWEGDTDKIGSRFYIQEPGDLSISFVPAEKWAGQRGEAGG